MWGTWLGGVVVGFTIGMIVTVGAVAEWSDFNWPEIVGNLLGGIIGAGGALAGVIVTDRLHERRDERRTELEAISLAIAVRPELERFRHAIRQAQAIADFSKEDLAAMQQEDSPLGLSRFRVGVPPILSTRIDRLHILGEAAAPAVQGAIAAVEDMNREIARWDPNSFDDAHTRSALRQRLPQHFRAIHRRLDSASEVADAAVIAVDGIVARAQDQERRHRGSLNAA